MPTPSARGWTLIELILVMTIIGIVAVFVGPVLLNSVKAYDRTQTTVNTYGTMRYAMERMAREIAAVRRNPANTTAYDVATMTAAAFTFTKEDGVQVTLNTAGTDANLTYVGTGSGVLADRVSALSFAYFRQDGTTAAADATELKYVQVSMTLSDGTSSYANRVRVTLRNVQ